MQSEDTCGGKPRLSGTRLTVDFVLRALQAVNGDVDAVVRSYPTVTKDGIEAAMDYVEQACPGCGRRRSLCTCNEPRCSACGHVKSQHHKGRGICEGTGLSSCLCRRFKS